MVSLFTLCNITNNLIWNKHSHKNIPNTVHTIFCMHTKPEILHQVLWKYTRIFKCGMYIHRWQHYCWAPWLNYIALDSFCSSNQMWSNQHLCAAEQIKKWNTKPWSAPLKTYFDRKFLKKVVTPLTEHDDVIETQTKNLMRSQIVHATPLLLKKCMVLILRGGCQKTSVWFNSLCFAAALNTRPWMRCPKPVKSHYLSCAVSRVWHAFTVEDHLFLLISKFYTSRFCGFKNGARITKTVLINFLFGASLPDMAKHRALLVKALSSMRASRKALLLRSGRKYNRDEVFANLQRQGLKLKLLSRTKWIDMK